MTAQNAEKLVTDDLIRESDLFAVMPENTFETDTCFVVFYQTKEFIKTRNFDNLAIGNGAVLVDKNTKKVYHTGSGKTVESYIESYEQYGDPFLEKDTLRLNIELEKTELGNNVLAKIKLLKAITGLGISDVKEVLINLRDGNKITISNDITDK
ncbi:hypothetical protein ACE193_09195 [Bernardetia sp. OM2101]|uniref:hypothetical protein n=1 Tax=Bernardetia sp. OM2101 TaxID=3344876 RepID=UPI0035CF95F4